MNEKKWIGTIIYLSVVSVEALIFFHSFNLKVNVFECKLYKTDKNYCYLHPD